MTTNKPIADIKEGRVRAAIWANQSKDGIRHTFTIERLYRKGEELKSASSFYLDDCERLQNVLSQVQSALVDLAEPAKEVA
mgnify:FL=1